ncbi:MAG: hypothetical protein AAGJ37_11465 [Pseudomonadota bacterium]
MTSELHSTVLRLAGKAAFEKGESLFKQNAILAFNLDGNQISAQVQDAYVFDIKLTVLNNGFDGGCTCPASEGFDFCEHCVAVALYYEQEQKALQELLTGKPADRVKGYLHTLKKDDLATELYKLLSEDADRFNQWLMFANIAIGDFDIKEARKRIVKAMPMRDVWRYQQVRNYFDKARKQMGFILEVIDKLPAENAYQLCLVALMRYDKILERIDDSGGFRFGLFHLIEKHTINAFVAIEESHNNKLARLLNVLDNEFTHVDFGDVGAKFIPRENSEFQALYYAELEKRYTAHTETSSKNLKLTSYANSLANYYERQGDLATSAKYAFQANPTFLSSYGYVTKLISSREYELAEQYLSAVHDRAKSYEDKYKVQVATYELKTALGKPEQAIDTAWALFEASLSVNDLQKVLDSAASIKSKGNTQTKIEILEKAEAKIVSTLNTNLPSDAKDFTPLLDFYIAFNRIPSAIQLARKHEFLEDSLHELAYVCVQNAYLDDGINLYKRLINQYVLKGQTKNYQTAIDLLLELIELNVKDDETSKVEELRAKVNVLLNEICFSHATKQQFMKMFNTQIHTQES